MKKAQLFHREDNLGDRSLKTAGNARVSNNHNEVSVTKYTDPSDVR